MKKCILALFLTLTLTAFARPKFRLLNFEVGGMRLTQDTGKTSAFIDFAYTPLWDAEDYGFRAFFEVTSGRNLQDKRILVTNTGGAMFVRVYSLINIEGVAGFLTQHDSAFSPYPLLGGGILLRVGENLFDRLFIAYYRVLSSTHPAGMLRCGFAFNI